MESKKRALRIVVLDARPDPKHEAVTATIAHALTSTAGERFGSEPPAPSSDDAPRSARPSGGPLESADAAVVFDPASWSRAREATVPFIAIVLPSFDTAWAGDLSSADCVIVAHQGLVDDVVHKGAERARVHVAGPVTPLGFIPAEDRELFRCQANVQAPGPLVLLTAEAVEQVGLEEIIAALAPVSVPAGLLIDVGEDVELADTLRQRAPSLPLGAWMFADGPDVHNWWKLADLVLGSARGHEVPRALGVGAPILLLPPGRSDRLAADVLGSTGAARTCHELGQLSREIEAAVETRTLATSRHAVEQLAAGASAWRVASVVREVWRGTRAPHGLPHGLERLGVTPRAPTAGNRIGP